MIAYGSGDLLQADTEALVNTVNCVGVMEQEIALQFQERATRRMFTATKGDANRQLPSAECCRHFWTARRLAAHHQLPHQETLACTVEAGYIDAGLIDLIRVIRELNIASVAVPPLRGIGQRDWIGKMRQRLVSAFQQLPDVDAVIYPHQVDLARARAIGASKDFG